MRLRKSAQDPADRRREEASRWFAILQIPELSPRTLRAWKKWEAVPENRKMFDEIERVWTRLQDGPRPQNASALEMKLDRYDGAQSVAEWHSEQITRAKRRPILRIVVAAMGIAVLTSAVFMGFDRPPLWSTVRDRLNTKVFETEIAQHQEILLRDGSRVQLGAKSAISSNITDTSRTVVLERGEALFKVAHDRARPFRVVAGGGTITAIGTAFNVRRLGEARVVVRVTEGTVEIATTAPKRDDVANWVHGVESAVNAGQRLVRGQEITYDLAGRFSPPRVADDEVAASWHDGRLQYRGEPLRDVIPDVNRYSHREVILEDNAAGDLLYSGTVFERDIEDWIEGLERTYPELDVMVDEDGRVLIRSRRAPQQ